MAFFINNDILHELQINNQEVGDDDTNTSDDYTNTDDDTTEDTTTPEPATTDTGNTASVDNLPPEADPVGEPDGGTTTNPAAPANNEDTPTDDTTADTGAEEAPADDTEDYTIPDDAAPADEPAPAADNAAEAPVETGDTGTADNADYTADTGDAAGGDDAPAGAADDAGTPDTTGDTGTDDTTTDDYTADTGDTPDAGTDDTGGGGDEGTTDDYTDDAGGDDTGDDGAVDDTTEDTTGERSDDEIVQLDRDIFSNLSDEEMRAKNITLKKQFLEMYETCSNIIESLDNIEKMPDNMAAVDFVTETLNDLRTMIADYVDNIYASKAYIENAIYYNKCLATLAGINKIIKELEAKEDKK